VADLCHVETTVEQELLNWQLDCLICIAALGFGDIPIKAILEKFSYMKMMCLGLQDW